MKNVTKDSLLLEVDADVRAERINQLWSRHKNHLFALIALIIVAAIGDAAYDHYRQSRGEGWMEKMTASQQLLETGNAVDAAESFAALAGETSGETQQLVRIWQARALVVAGNMNEAVAVLKLASVGHSIWGDVACLRLASLAPKDATCLNAAQPSPLAETRRLWAAAAAWDAGKTEEATAQLKQLVEAPATSENTRVRAQQWLGVMQNASAKGAR